MSGEADERSSFFLPMTLAFVFHGEVDLPRFLIPTLTTYFLFQPPLQVKWAPSEDAADGAADEKSLLPPLVANDDSSEDGSRDAASQE